MQAFIFSLFPRRLNKCTSTNHREERTYCSHGTEVKQWKVLTSEVVSKTQTSKCCKIMNSRSCGSWAVIELAERDVNPALPSQIMNSRSSRRWAELELLASLASHLSRLSACRMFHWSHHSQNQILYYLTLKLAGKIWTPLNQQPLIGIWFDQSDWLINFGHEAVPIGWSANRLIGESP